jgi:hypothetical protein
MALVATNRYMNFGVFSFNSVVFTGVTDFGIDYGVSDKQEGSDADPGPSVAVVDWQNPSFTVTTLDALALQSSIGGARGIFVATLLDAYNKALTGGGAKQYTTNALSYITGGNVTSRYREFANRQLVIKTVWADGATNPVSLAPL